MRIGGGVTVAGKVFGRAQHSILFGTGDVGSHKIADQLRVFSKRSRVDDGIGRIGIHVGDWEQVPLHAQRARLLRHDLAESFCQLRLARRPESHSVREHGCSIHPH